MSTVKIQLTDACCVGVKPDGTPHLAAAGQQLELPADDALAVIGSGRAVLLAGELPDAQGLKPLKPAKAKAA